MSDTLKIAFYVILLICSVFLLRSISREGVGKGILKLIIVVQFFYLLVFSVSRLVLFIPYGKVNYTLEKEDTIINIEGNNLYSEGTMYELKDLVDNSSKENMRKFYSLEELEYPKVSVRKYKGQKENFLVQNFLLKDKRYVLVITEQ